MLGTLKANHNFKNVANVFLNSLTSSFKAGDS